MGSQRVGHDWATFTSLEWNVPLVSLIFLKRSLVFPIPLFSCISLHWSLRKAFLSLLAILWNSAFISIKPKLPVAMYGCESWTNWRRLYAKELKLLNCGVGDNKCLVTQSCLTLCDPIDCSLPEGWGPLGKNTRVGRHSLLQRIFSIQGSNPGLLYCSKWILHHLTHQLFCFCSVTQ